MSSNPELSISLQEQASLARKDLASFWFSPLKKKDPVARIGYALWCKDAEALRSVIDAGPASYWDNKGFAYWELLARTTAVNLATGLERAGFEGTFGEMREKIREVGFEVARLHAIFVRRDIKGGIGERLGILSLQQIADYHHVAFQKFGIPSHFYGGTWVEALPDKAEFYLYGQLYCHDCDSAEGYRRVAQ